MVEPFQHSSLGERRTVERVTAAVIVKPRRGFVFVIESAECFDYFE